MTAEHLPTPDEQTLPLVAVDPPCAIGQCRHTTRAEKQQAHGTPSEFEDAVWRACDDLFVTTEEALEAIDRYRTEFYGAARMSEVDKPTTQPSSNEKSWRCFHCDEVFMDEAAAREHFGPSELCSPGCHIGISEYRRMEEIHRGHMAEDSEMHRRLYALQAEHQTALRREEEKGYARGLEDAKKHPETLGLRSDDSPSAPETLAECYCGRRYLTEKTQALPKDWPPPQSGRDCMGTD